MLPCCRSRQATNVIIRKHPSSVNPFFKFFYLYFSPLFISPKWFLKNAFKRKAPLFSLNKVHPSFLIFSHPKSFSSVYCQNFFKFFVFPKTRPLSIRFFLRFFFQSLILFVLKSKHPLNDRERPYLLYAFFEEEST